MVKATITGKKVTELEGDMILGTAVLYRQDNGSEAFVVGEVERALLPTILGRTSAMILAHYFSGKALEETCVVFKNEFLAAVAGQENSNEEETGKEN